MRPVACPECAAVLVSAGSGPPWCSRCEWNLDAVPLLGHGRRALREQRLVQASYALDRELFAELSEAAGPRRGRMSARLLAVAAASVLLAMIGTTLIILGVVMIVTASWPVKIVGAFLIGCVMELRPRLPGVEDSPWCRTRSQEPALFAVIDAVAAQVGSPSVELVVVDETFDASCARYGLRRRRVLVLGLPLWAALGPEGRTALLAHQLAHLVDGDPDQDLLTQPALTTFGELARSFAQRGRLLPDVEVAGGKCGEITAGQFAAMMGAVGPTHHSYESMSGGLSALVCKPLHWACASAHRTLRGLTAEARHRAEYYADALAVEVAGSAGMLEYCSSLALSDSVFTTTRRWLRVGADVAIIQIEAAEVRDGHRVDLRNYEQRSIRTDSSLTAAHPPIGWRLRMVRSWPPAAGRFAPGELDFDSVDAQLSADYQRVGRALTHIA